jgi:hypothetical protein
MCFRMVKYAYAVLAIWKQKKEETGIKAVGYDE